MIQIYPFSTKYELKIIIWRYHEINNHPCYSYVQPKRESNFRNLFMFIKPLRQRPNVRNKYKRNNNYRHTDVCN